MASAIPIDFGIAGEQFPCSGEFFTFAMGTSFKGAGPAAGGYLGRAYRSRSRGNHRRSAGGDGRPR